MTQTIPMHPRVLVIGNGAREHTLVWALANSPLRPTLFCAPGNPGIANHAELVNLSADDVGGIVRWATEHQIDLVVPGPEAPLAAGITDAVLEAGIAVFGPVQAAAQLESSKAFAKAIMKQAGVPTAAYQEFTDAGAAKQYILSQGAPIVVKADGLAAGKGVTVAETVEQALTAVDEMMVGQRFGLSGERIVVEAYLTGTEVSLMFFVSGDAVIPMLPARDHKRVYDHDEGPNTGGMGAFAPVTAFTEAGLVPVVEERIVRPVLRQLAAEGIVYCGVLYAGLMVTAEGPQVIEFNCRFGDPETEVVLPLLASDLLEVMWAAATGSLQNTRVNWKPGAAVSIVCASAGYPDKPKSGDIITLPKQHSSDTVVFHAGTRQLSDGTLVTAGGRVLAVTGWAADFDGARQIAYQLATAVHFEGKHLRTDIGTNRGLSVKA